MDAQRLLEQFMGLGTSDNAVPSAQDDRSLRSGSGIGGIAGGLAAGGPEQAAEIYLASRLAIDPDHPAEHAYLDALASRLSLPAELVAHLESQAAQAT